MERVLEEKRLKITEKSTLPASTRRKYWNMLFPWNSLLMK
jgi:hypothetical protein